MSWRSKDGIPHGGLYMPCLALRGFYSSPCRHPAATGGGVINPIEGQLAVSLLVISSQQSQIYICSGIRCVGMEIYCACSCTNVCKVIQY